MKLFLSLALTLSMAITFFGQTPANQQSDKITLGTSEVVLDVVVRDKKG